MKLTFHFESGHSEEFVVRKPIVTIGRANVCDVVIPLEGFSRKHAQIELIDGDIFVTDLGSTNGVLIDGQRIPSRERIKMQSFLNLQIGPALQVEIEDEEAARAEVNIPQQSVRSQAPKQPVADEMTRTIRMETKPRKPKKKIERPTSKVALLLVPLLILGGGWYFYQQTKETTPEAVVEVKPALPAEPVLNAVTASPLSTETLLKLQLKRNCDPSRWCTAAGLLSSQQEGVAIEGKQLVLFLQMGDVVSASSSVESPEEALELWLMRRLIESGVLREFMRQTELESIEAVGLINNAPRLALHLKRDLHKGDYPKLNWLSAIEKKLNAGVATDWNDLKALYERTTFDH